MGTVHLIYFSPTNNTETMIKKVAHELGSHPVIHDLTKPKKREKILAGRKELCFNSEDIVLIGAPVYGGRLPKFLLPLWNQMEGNGAAAVCIVSYGNRAYEDALLELKDICEERGFSVIGAAAFLGEHSYTNQVAQNRPDSHDLKIAADFGEAIKANLVKKRDGRLTIPGNHPYIEKQRKSVQYAPITEDTCIGCGMCEAVCPMGCITKEDFKAADEAKCIHCCACIKNCKMGAKTFPQEEFLVLKEWLETNYLKPVKEPEIFLR